MQTTINIRKLIAAIGNSGQLHCAVPNLEKNKQGYFSDLVKTHRTIAQ